MGAAVQAGILAGEITDLILLDVTPLSLGVETMGGLMTTIITRNASIPVKQSEIFSTGADQQDTVEIHVLQGERSFAKDNKSLGIFKLRGIPPAPRGVPRINVTFQLDVNGLLAVSAREEKSGQEQSIKIEGASILAREDVSKMIKEAEENAGLDKIRKAKILIKYEFDTFLNKSEKLFPLVKNQKILQLSQLYENLIEKSKELILESSYSEFNSTFIQDLELFYTGFILIETRNKILKNSYLTDSGSKQSKKRGKIIDVTDD